MTNLSYMIIPAVMMLLGVGMTLSKKDMFSEFVLGAKEGIKCAFDILPTLVALLAAIYMFNASGAADVLVKMLSPIGKIIGIPEEIIPLIVIRPLSGSGSTALIADIYKKYGPESFAGRCASVIAGSSDTLLYVVSVYFGAVNIKKTRGTIPISFFVMVFCVFFSVFLCRLLF